MNKLKLISDCKYELMVLIGGVGQQFTDSPILFSIFIFILIIGIVGALIMAFYSLYKLRIIKRN
jgi:beta-lactamase regulating signal transducer with metallopeptidase domain